MKNFIMAFLTGLSGLVGTKPDNAKKHKKCECASCFIKKSSNLRIRKKREDKENTKEQEKRSEEE